MITVFLTRLLSKRKAKLGDGQEKRTRQLPSDTRREDAKVAKLNYNEKVSIDFS